MPLFWLNCNPSWGCSWRMCPPRRCPNSSSTLPAFHLLLTPVHEKLDSQSLISFPSFSGMGSPGSSATARLEVWRFLLWSEETDRHFFLDLDKCWRRESTLILPREEYCVGMTGLFCEVGSSRWISYVRLPVFLWRDVNVTSHWSRLQWGGCRSGWIPSLLVHLLLHCEEVLCKVFISEGSHWTTPPLHGSVLRNERLNKWGEDHNLNHVYVILYTFSYQNCG